MFHREIDFREVLPLDEAPGSEVLGTFMRSSQSDMSDIFTERYMIGLFDRAGNSDDLWIGEPDPGTKLGRVVDGIRDYRHGIYRQEAAGDRHHRTPETRHALQNTMLILNLASKIHISYRRMLRAGMTKTEAKKQLLADISGNSSVYRVCYGAAIDSMTTELAALERGGEYERPDVIEHEGTLIPVIYSDDFSGVRPSPEVEKHQRMEDLEASIRLHRLRLKRLEYETKMSKALAGLL